MIDVHSETWAIVAEHAEKKLNAARTQLEQHGVDTPLTENLRGRIAALREVLDLTNRRGGPL